MEVKNTFHLGITMAGAVSAGCYTAGVMDYLFEALDLWEKAKKEQVEGIDPDLVPKNNVTIDAMGGTSAGGMTTIMSCLYAIRGNINPVKEVPENPLETKNVLYDSWVHLDDDKDVKTFSKIWNTDDLTEKLGSLFNSKVIDEIAEKSFKEIDENLDYVEHLKKSLPSFISPELEVLISHTLLRGIPLSVDFKAEIAKRRVDSPNHNTFEHYLISHFKLNNGNKVDENEFLWLNPFKKKYADKIKLSTISTGAFPVGLAFREFDQTQFNDKYIKSITKKIITGKFGKSIEELNDIIEIKNFPKNFESITVDGGAINNEPYREVASILEDKYPKNEKKHRDFGLIMIDPFPDSGYSKNNKYKKPKNLLSVAPNIIQALWNQSKVKRKEMIEQYDTDYFKTLIYPSKFYTKDDLKTVIGKDHKPLTSASFNAFGGFLDINFRVHDFFLGRNNARNFMQYFGSFPYEPSDDPEKNNVHPMHVNWTKKMVDQFKIIKEDGSIYLPIIPDLNMVLQGTKSGDNRFKYDVRFKPKYDSSRLFALKDKIEIRFKAIVNRAIKDVSKIEKNNVNHPISDKLIKKQFKKSFFGRLSSKVSGWIISGIKKPAKNAIAKFLTKFVIKIILHDLEDRKILKEEN